YLSVIIPPCGQRTHCLSERFNHAVDIKGSKFVPVCVTESQEGFNQLLGPIKRTLGICNVFRQVIVLQLLSQHVQIPLCRGQNVIKIMSYTARKGPDSLHFFHLGHPAFERLCNPFDRKINSQRYRNNKKSSDNGV